MLVKSPCLILSKEALHRWLQSPTFTSRFPCWFSFLDLKYLCSVLCNCSFVGRLFCHALEGSRPKSVLVHSLSVCISLLDPKRLASASYQAFRSNVSHGALVTASPETVDGMLESLGECWVFCARFC